MLDGIENFAAAREPSERPRTLTDADAVEIWIARWLRVRPKSLVHRYGCDPRRLYEIWWGERFPGSRAKAEKVFRQRYPGIVERTSFGYRRIPAAAPKAEERRQLKLFD
ncbi:MAG: hypothetical protein R3D44_09840 [Hyphomicrobiaceae bacterium]